MEVKISTKEKFTVLTPNYQNLTDTVAQNLQTQCNNILQNNEIKNMVLNLESITSIDTVAANTIANLQQFFYENNVSFVVCCLAKNIEDSFDKLELLEIMNITPTESEAWDIVQMEEIERELLDEL